MKYRETSAEIRARYDRLREQLYGTMDEMYSSEVEKGSKEFKRLRNKANRLRRDLRGMRLIYPVSIFDN